MCVFTYKKIAGAILIITISIMILPINACSENKYNSGIEERERELIHKLVNGEKLSSNEINNLAGIFIYKEEYEKGISLFEKMLTSPALYKKELYIINFNLALFYAQKAKKAEDTQRKELIKKIEEYLKDGVKYSPTPSIALYKRSLVYENLYCLRNAKKDLQEAIDLVSLKDLVFWEEGIYISREKFTKLLRQKLDALEKYEDACILENYK